MKPRKLGGLILIELLLSLTMIVFLAGALAYAFGAGLAFQKAAERRRDTRDAVTIVERTITRLLQGATLSDNASDTTTYFTGAAEAYSDTGDFGCDKLTFTTMADNLPMEAIYNEDTSDVQNTDYGPVGGVSEICLNLTSEGDSGDQTGLFERIQCPSDGDPTQGGNQKVLSPDIQRIGFQFWDGTQWLATWDTSTNQFRLPAAVKVSYTLVGQSNSDMHTFVVAIPASDVTADNPLSGGS